MSKNIRFVSFDPASYRNLGCAIGNIISKKKKVNLEVVASTFVMQSESDEPWSFLWPTFQVVDHLFSQTKPDIVIIEKTSSFAGGFVTGQVSNVMGVILALCGKYNIQVEFVYPTHVKKVVTGKGKATKKEIKIAVTNLLNGLNVNSTKFDSDHAYDAVSNLLTYMHESKNINYTIGG